MKDAREVKWTIVECGHVSLPALGCTLSALEISGIVADCAGELYQELEVDLSSMVAKGFQWKAASPALEAKSRAVREVCLFLG